MPEFRCEKTYYDIGEGLLFKITEFPEETADLDHDAE
jgi:hypothetical protein